MSDNKHIHYSKAESVSVAVNTRRSLRAFTDTPLPNGTIDEILTSAARAPSGTNIQPWNVYVLTGKSRDKLCAAVCDAFDDPDAKHEIEVSYYPDKWFEPYLARRRKIGWDLYGLLDIKKGDREKTHLQHKRNFQFFDAPVGLVFTLHRDLSTGSWLDYGMFLQNIMLLDQAEVVVCGMAVGYAEETAIENSLVSERANLSEFVRYFD